MASKRTVEAMAGVEAAWAKIDATARVERVPGAKCASELAECWGVSPSVAVEMAKRMVKEGKLRAVKSRARTNNRVVTCYILV